MPADQAAPDRLTTQPPGYEGQPLLRLVVDSRLHRRNHD